MELINLKTPITFRVVDPTVAFTTKVFIGRRSLLSPKEPNSQDHVYFDVFEIGNDPARSDAVTNPYFKLPKPQRISIIWSNVLSVHYEDTAI